jgi:hypothetical protein
MLAAAKYGRIRALEQQHRATATAKGEEEGVGRVSVSVNEAAAVSVDAPLPLPPVPLLPLLLPPSDYMERILAVPPTRDFSLHRLRAQLAMLEDESTAS